MKRLLFIVPVILLSIGLFVFISRSEESQPEPESATVQQQETQEQTNQPVTYRTLTGNEYKELFLASSHPNTKTIVTPPVITGNVEADAKIVELATERGYELQEAPKTDLNKYGEHLLQEKLVQAWDSLAAEAQQAGHVLNIESAQRSIDDQRELFISALSRNGIVAADIARGAADESVNQVLTLAAPPGFSRHHSGYVIDISDESADVFEFSDGYGWLSADNYLKAKEHGFIPSYPDGAQNQGPEPEAWEYVWVGQSLLIE